MSSMDSVLLVAASTLFKNMVDPFTQVKAGVRWTRVAVVGFAVLAAILALRPPGDIVEITIFSGSLYAVCFLPAVLLGLHWQKGSAPAVLWSMGIGTVVLVVWLVGGYREYLHEVFPALLASLLVYVVLSANSETVIPRSLGMSELENPGGR